MKIIPIYPKSGSSYKNLSTFSASDTQKDYQSSYILGSMGPEQRTIVEMIIGGDRDVTTSDPMAPFLAGYIKEIYSGDNVLTSPDQITSVLPTGQKNIKLITDVYLKRALVQLSKEDEMSHILLGPISGSLKAYTDPAVTELFNKKEITMKKNGDWPSLHTLPEIKSIIVNMIKAAQQKIESDKPPVSLFDTDEGKQVENYVIKFLSESEGAMSLNTTQLSIVMPFIKINIEKLWPQLRTLEAIDRTEAIQKVALGEVRKASNRDASRSLFRTYKDDETSPVDIHTTKEIDQAIAKGISDVDFI